MSWIVDDSDYRQNYFDAIAHAPIVLGPDISVATSRPQSVAMSSRYEEQNLKLLILGQETFENFSLLSAHIPFHDWAFSIGESIAFDFANGGDRQGSGPFWTAYDTFRRKFGHQDRRSIAWSNPSKSQLLKPVGGRVSSRLHNRLGFEDYANWQRRLFRNEMRFLSPHGVLAFIGIASWHEQLLHRMYPNADTVWHDDDGYRVWECAEMPFSLVSTYHPNGSNARVPPAVAASNATEALMRLLRQRGHRC